jgi:hypothetical protein
MAKADPLLSAATPANSGGFRREPVDRVANRAQTDVSH